MSPTPDNRNDHGIGERTTFSRDLLMFYAACTVCGTAAAVAAVCLIVFNRHEVAVWIGVVGVVVTIVTALLSWHYLRKARYEA